MALPAAPAVGHSPLGATFPQDGAVVERLPPVVRINFDGSVRVISVLVTGPAGVHSVSARLASGDRSLILVRTMRPLAGQYRVQWEVEGTDDHSYSGQFDFRALKGPPPAPTPPADPSDGTASSGDDRTGLIAAGAGALVLAAVAAGIAAARRRRS
jgi:methionine-rich copper-binding protein CopC